MIVECTQGTAEWLALRVGRVTGSRVADVMAEIKKGEAAARRNYRTELVVESLTGLTAEHYVSKEMEWGMINETFARAAYEVHMDCIVDDVGFAVHPTIERLGASPDGLVGDDGVLEIKCPATSTHLDYLLAGVVPPDYHAQMLTEMVCTGRKWCDFVSFDPRLPANLQLFVRRFHRDDTRIAEIEKRVQHFLFEVDEIISRLSEVKTISQV